MNASIIDFEMPILYKISQITVLLFDIITKSSEKVSLYCDE